MSRIVILQFGQLAHWDEVGEWNQGVVNCLTSFASRSGDLFEEVPFTISKSGLAGG